jgi:putative serine protease PepD
MTLPDKTNMPDQPWWQPVDSQPKSFTYNTFGGSSFSKKNPNSFLILVTVLVSLVSGAIGATIGRTTSGSANIVSTQNSIERAPDSIAGIAARVSPSVVEIDVTASSGSDTGSGFFIDSDGYILTNNHVVEAAASGGRIRVTLANGKKYDAKIVGRDSSYDLAVLKTDLVNAAALQFGDSDKVAVGDAVIAIGSPLGLAGTVTSGIISAKNRPVTAGNGSGESSFISALQTDAAINPGNSGGPLVDATGAVIGVNSAIASLGSAFGGQSGSIGLGFAIPINQARKTADQLIKNGFATYPILGVSIDSRYSGDGALVSNQSNAILPGGPAEKAGLKPGDVIIAIDDQAINSSDELIVAIRKRNVGDKVTVKYVRNSITRQVNLILAASKKQ